MATREFDIVLLGASGFTGQLVAEYLLSQYGDSDLKWAMAGRNQAKLEAVRDSLSGGEMSPGKALALVGKMKKAGMLRGLPEPVAQRRAENFYTVALKLLPDKMSAKDRALVDADRAAKVCAEGGVGRRDTARQRVFLRRPRRRPVGYPVRQDSHP